jgi:hypothetical protein
VGPRNCGVLQSALYSVFRSRARLETACHCELCAPHCGVWGVLGEAHTTGGGMLSAEKQRRDFCRKSCTLMPLDGPLTWRAVLSEKRRSQCGWARGEFGVSSRPCHWTAQISYPSATPAQISGLTIAPLSPNALRNRRGAKRGPAADATSHARRGSLANDSRHLERCTRCGDADRCAPPSLGLAAELLPLAH